jgi:hypothetical protein
MASSGDDGWVDMQVQFLIDKKSAGANHVVGWTVLKPGARHVNHRQQNCDEFFIVLKGKGMIYTDHGDKPSSEGDVVYSPRGCWQASTTRRPKTLCWSGAGWAPVRSRIPATKCIRRATSDIRAERSGAGSCRPHCPPPAGQVDCAHRLTSIGTMDLGVIVRTAVPVVV